MENIALADPGEAGGWPLASLVVGSHEATGTTPNCAVVGLFRANIGERKAFDNANLHQSLHEPLWLRMG
ncbi:hypothetical protein [Mesorhizobium sp. M7A.F.Ca.CA.001.14.1.1]|uniref:hypothetical protein n=1 Tax=Mesorhizobium sp. M7A.F.Ca.CA.001.14.1.1 TaxID=2496706 RepID=UPI0013E3E887|nr:hypothetical protein [Mesorhizobium sp. M7A.F.Ca.CA.001.14.1.1]